MNPYRAYPRGRILPRITQDDVERAWDEGAAAERAAVESWLRKLSEKFVGLPDQALDIKEYSNYLDHLADCVASEVHNEGAHAREKE